VIVPNVLVVLLRNAIPIAKRNAVVNVNRVHANVINASHAHVNAPNASHAHVNAPNASHM